MLDDRCWWCHEPAPSGVCPGPHPDFDIERVQGNMLGRRHQVGLRAVFFSSIVRDGDDEYAYDYTTVTRNCVCCDTEFTVPMVKHIALPYGRDGKRYENYRPSNRKTCSTSCSAELGNKNRPERLDNPIPRA